MDNIKSRQLDMILFLLKNKKSTYKDLSEKFEISIKTVERDINKISAMGIPIYCNRGKGGGVYIDDKFKFSTSFFTNDDIQSIILGLTIFDSFAKIPRKENILKKLYLLNPDLVSFLQFNIDEYFIADIFDKKIDVQNKVCQEINQCMENEVLIEIILKDKIKKVAPISYVLRKDGLHLYCFDIEYHLIKISDIVDSKIIDEKFVREFIKYKEIF